MKFFRRWVRTVRRLSTKLPNTVEQASQCWCWCSFVTMTIEYDSSSNSFFSTRPDGCRTQTSLTHQRPYHPVVYCTCTTNLSLRISTKDWIEPQGRLHDSQSRRVVREREIGFLVTESIWTTLTIFFDLQNQPLVDDTVKTERSQKESRKQFN